MPLAIAKMDQDITMCSEVNQRERQKYHEISPTSGICRFIPMNYHTKQKQTYKLHKPTYDYKKKKKSKKEEKLRLLHYHIHTNMYPLDNQKGHTELHRECY